MRRIKIEDIKIKLLSNCEDKKKRPTDSLILEMLENTDLQSLEVEPTKTGNGFNRGSIVECVTRYQLNAYLNGTTAKNYSKSAKKEDFTTVKKSAEMCKDLGLQSGQKYEIKLISSLARASMSAPIKTDCIIIDLRRKSLGAYLVKPCDLVIYRKGSTVGIDGYTNGQKLELLGELLGL